MSPPWYAPLLRCLSCGAAGLEVDPTQVRCPACTATWPVVEGVPMLARSSPAAADRHAAIEAAVRAFYEKNPFPTYDEFDSVGSLLDKARRSVYAQLLDDQVPPAARVLEVGCGTGQLAIFLSVAGRRCLGVDLCMASLRCGQQFRDRHGLQTVGFVQGNVFDLPVVEGAFDLVIAKGVLHHTPDAQRAFLEVARRVRPGGYLIVGLYNRYGRVPSWLRKQLFRLVGREALGGDYVMRHVLRSADKRRIWWEDQYNHPHETWHSVDEVLGWFRTAGLSYISAYPPITLGRTPRDREDRPALFAPSRPGHPIEHLLVQLSWMFTIGREGALFDLIARRPPES
ncbi:MAG: methyltransferase domain-containing protein [Myxococcales bacterium]|nr:methyltransferase domain-containing protein [Myxococcota bacterium]MDW8282023.1 methyltransferase domain-containing protein [Myxococcales bacterium]